MINCHGKVEKKSTQKGSRVLSYISVAWSPLVIPQRGSDEEQTSVCFMLKTQKGGKNASTMLNLVPFGDSKQGHMYVPYNHAYTLPLSAVRNVGRNRNLLDYSTTVTSSVARGLKDQSDGTTRTKGVIFATFLL